jgi:RNA polymerase sigma-70 factor (ECF subfamily)
MNNHSLIERIKREDGEQVLKEIYKQYRNEFLQWVIRNHDCTIEEAKDLFQQTILTFYENIVNGKTVEINVHMKTYIFGIAKNKLMEMLRGRKAGGRFDDLHLEMEEDTADGQDAYAHDYDTKLSTIEQYLRKVGDPCKTILEYYYYHKKSMQDIAELLDYKNSETVKNLKYKCIMRLRKLLSTSGTAINPELS